MKKVEAIEIFGRQVDLAAALGITRSAVAQWPADLTQRQADLVRGAALRLGKICAPAPSEQAA